jgi:hypothetical protein
MPPGDATRDYPARMPRTIRKDVPPEGQGETPGTQLDH